MNKNIKIAKELVKLAKNLIALDEEGDGSGFQVYHDHENNEQERLDLAQKQGKKYILHHKEGRFWKIQACKDFSNVKKGDFGGFIKSEKNLSHEGDCWVSEDAQVYDNAQVRGNAQVFGDANVFGNAQVSGNAFVFDWAQVSGNAQISGKAIICGMAKVYDKAKVSDQAQVRDKANVYGNAKISGKAKVDYNVKDQEIAE